MFHGALPQFRFEPRAHRGGHAHTHTHTSWTRAIEFRVRPKPTALDVPGTTFLSRIRLADAETSICPGRSVRVFPVEQAPWRRYERVNARVPRYCEHTSRGFFRARGKGEKKI